MAHEYGAEVTFTYDATHNYNLGIVIRGGVTVSNIVFRPMIRLASIADATYEPYIPDNTELMRYTDNAVLGAKNRLPNKATSQTVNGVTFTKNADGTITANGTATSNARLGIASASAMANACADADVILSGCPSGGSEYKYQIYIRTSAGYLHEYGDSIVIPQGTSFIEELSILVSSGQTVSNIVFKPMLRLATDTDDTYVPYAMTNRELTEKVDDLHYYGILNSLAIPSFTNGTRLQQMTILEIFNALPLESQDGIYVGSEINISTYNGTNILFDNIKSVTKLGSLGAGMLNIQKFESARGIVTYRLDNKIFQCTILNSALTTCYSSTLTAV